MNKTLDQKFKNVRSPVCILSLREDPLDYMKERKKRKEQKREEERKKGERRKEGRKE